MLSTWIRLRGCALSEREIMIVLTANLPEGIKPINLAEIPLNDPAISGKIQQFIYQVTFLNSISPTEIERRIAAFEDVENFDLTRDHKGKKKIRNLKLCVRDLEFSNNELTMKIENDSSGFVHPVAALTAILQMSQDQVTNLRILKKDAVFS